MNTHMIRNTRIINKGVIILETYYYNFMLNTCDIPNGSNVVDILTSELPLILIKENETIITKSDGFINEIGIVLKGKLNIISHNN